MLSQHKALSVLVLYTFVGIVSILAEIKCVLLTYIKSNTYYYTRRLKENEFTELNPVIVKKQQFICVSLML